MYRHLSLLALILVLGLSGCDRQRDEPPQPSEPSGTPGERMNEPEPATPPNGGTTRDDLNGGTTMDDGTTMNDGTTMDDGTATDTQICTPEWFASVHQQVQAMPDGDITQLYPSGLPEVGSEKWFAAIDKLTGGDGASGPDGGTPEWCSMIQQRLSQSSSPSQSPQSSPSL